MENSQPKSSIRKGWQLAKSAWHVLRLDKELTFIPLISSILSILALVGIGIGYLAATGGFTQIIDTHSLDTTGSSLPAWESLLFGLGTYFVLTVIANFFGAAIIYGATERFRGGDPTLQSSLAGAGRKFRPLLLFSLMMATIGFALQTLEERLPFAGRIAVWLAGAAWNIANFFAIPVIVLSEGDVHPFDATRESVRTIKKVWGESVVANLGIGLVFLLVFLAYLFGSVALSAAVGITVSNLHLSGWIMAPVIGLVLVGFLAIILVFTALNSIIKAAVYHYAVTGEAPGVFDRELLRAAMTKKKARKLFS